MATDAQLQRSVNKWGARIIPLLLIGIVGFATWVFVVLLAVNYLLRPPQDVPTRTGAGIAVIVIYFVLFTPMTLSYFRLLHVVRTSPGYVRNQKYPDNEAAPNIPDEPATMNEAVEDGTDPARTTAGKFFFDRGAVLSGRVPAPPGLEEFYMRDVFECDIDGLPRYCVRCEAWKPDRSHHCSEVNRCVYKMDHYCPWAGGVVSETNFKFFIQFVFYTMLFTGFVLIVMAYFTSKIHHKRNIYDVTWIVVIALAALFLMFSGGMVMTTLRYTLLNTTTVDSITRGTRMYNFAVLVPPPTAPRESPAFASTVTNQAQAQTQTQTQAPPLRTPASNPTYLNGRFGIITYPLPSTTQTQTTTPQSPPRTFVIIPIPTGTNPYRLSSAVENLKTVLGEKVLDWFLPLRHSPCSSHTQLNLGHESGTPASSMYKLGPGLGRICAENGIPLSPPSTRDTNTTDSSDRDAVEAEKMPERSWKGRWRRKNENENEHEHEHEKTPANMNANVNANGDVQV